jgi:hypothetical protein
MRASALPGEEVMIGLFALCGTFVWGISMYAYLGAAGFKTRHRIGGSIGMIAGVSTVVYFYWFYLTH